mgnify:FL=1
MFLVKTGWTHDNYEAAPDDLINQMVMLFNAEGEAAKIQMEQAEVKRR